MENEKPKYACRNCGCIEIISNPNACDTFIAEGDALYYRKSELTYDPLEFFCQYCGKAIPYANPKII